MTNIKNRRPGFVGRDWGDMPQGYRYLATPSARLIEQISTVESGDWLQLLEIFEEAKQGNFVPIKKLPNLIFESDDFHVRSMALRILGDASPRSTASAIEQAFRHPDIDTRLAAYAATAHSADLVLARRLARVAPDLDQQFELDFLADSISMLLEPMPNEFVEPTDGRSYLAKVEARIDQIEQHLGLEQAVLFGRKLNISNLIECISTIASSENSAELLGLLEDYLSIFEAMTGVISDDWFEVNGSVDPIGVLAEMRAFERTGAARYFKIGTRYFFGHLIA